MLRRGYHGFRWLQEIILLRRGYHGFRWLYEMLMLRRGYHGFRWLYVMLMLGVCSSEGAVQLQCVLPAGGGWRLRPALQRSSAGQGLWSTTHHNVSTSISDMSHWLYWESDWGSLCLPDCLTVFLYVCLPVSLSVSLHVCLSLCLSLSACPSVCLSVSLSGVMSVPLPVCLSG